MPGLKTLTVELAGGYKVSFGMEKAPGGTLCQFQIPSNLGQLGFSLSWLGFSLPPQEAWGLGGHSGSSNLTVTLQPAVMLASARKCSSLCSCELLKGQERTPAQERTWGKMH